MKSLRESVAPTDFVTQVLEPTGGKMLRPRDWFYRECHRGPTYAWTISREDPSHGSYTTGVSIQTFINVQSGTGKTPREFVLDFLEKKRQSAKVIETYPETDQGLFVRVGLHTEEAPHRITYSLFWGRNTLDLVVVVVAGTAKELWATFAPTFAIMEDFELIDMSRFGE
jgi:hypothetical protein